MQCYDSAIESVCSVRLEALCLACHSACCHTQRSVDFRAPPSFTASLSMFHFHLPILLSLTATVLAMPPAADVRTATFNISFNSDQLSTDGSESNPDALPQALASGLHPNLRKIAAILQRVNADVILLNEFDLAYRGQEFDEEAARQRVKDFCAKYLEVPQPDGAAPVTYAHHFIAPTNTGVHSGHDLNGDGAVKSAQGGNKKDARAYGGDAFGFGQYPGKYGMVLLSKHPIDHAKARTFQKFRWIDMPGALLPADPDDTDLDGDRTNYYSAAEREVFRLASKSHWDVPVLVKGQTIHFLCSHPTPPSFDDGTTATHLVKTGSPATKADWNGLRNHDEIRFWADYVNPAASGYIYDDAEWLGAGARRPAKPSGGLPAGARFILLGDQNADPVDGNSTFHPIRLLLDSPLWNAEPAPKSPGSLEQVGACQQQPETKTSRFNLRVDYVLPSRRVLEVVQNGVFWPLRSDPLFHLLSASDHRCVWADLQVLPAE